MVIHNVAARLKSDGQRLGEDGMWSIDGEAISTFGELVDFICDRVEDEGSREHWAGGRRRRAR